MNSHENIRRTRLITETAVSVALATLLGFIRLYRLPWGGALSLKLLPLIYLAFKHGPKAGADERSSERKNIRVCEPLSHNRLFGQQRTYEP